MMNVLVHFVLYFSLHMQGILELDMKKGKVWGRGFDFNPEHTGWSSG